MKRRNEKREKLAFDMHFGGLVKEEETGNSIRCSWLNLEKRSGMLRDSYLEKSTMFGNRNCCFDLWW